MLPITNSAANQTLFIASLDGSIAAAVEITPNMTIGDFVNVVRKIEAVKLQSQLMDDAAAAQNQPTMNRVEVLPEELALRPAPIPIQIRRVEAPLREQKVKHPPHALEVKAALKKLAPWIPPAGFTDVYVLYEETLRTGDQKGIKWCKKNLLSANTISVKNLLSISVRLQDYNPTEFCINYILKKRKFDLLESFLRGAIELQDANVKWYAFILTYVMVNTPVISFVEFKTSYDKFTKWGEWGAAFPALKNLVSSNFLPPQEREIVELAIECGRHSIAPSFSILGKRKIEISEGSSTKIDELAIKFLDRLNKTLSVDWILLGNMDNDSTLNRIASVIPSPYGVGINYSKVKGIPEIWSQNIKWIYLQVVPELKELRASEANTVEFWGCGELEVISAPKVKRLDLGSRLNRLQHVTVPSDCKIINKQNFSIVESST